MPKRKLTPEEKKEAEKIVLEREKAAHPGENVSVVIYDDSDDDGNAVGKLIRIEVKYGSQNPKGR